MDVNFFITIAVLVISVILHEVAHGYAANSLGDPTARLAGRLTLNPLKHLDPVGSIIVPALLALSGTGVVFGWAKPVPYNPYNLGGGKYAEAKVAGAGPLTNLILALLAGLTLRFASALLPVAFTTVLALTVIVNLVLMLFNLVPIPPLDGSKILFALLPPHLLEWRYKLERYGLFIVILFAVFFAQLLTPIIGFFFSLITGFTL